MGRTKPVQEDTKKMDQSRVPVTMRDFFFDDPFFKNSWDDFEKVRERMFAESRDNWKKFDEDFRNMSCMSNNIMLESSQQEAGKESSTAGNEARDLMRQDSKTRWENGWMFPRKWMLPALKTDMMKDLDLFKSKDNEVIRVKDDEKKMAARWYQGCFPGNTHFLPKLKRKTLFLTFLLMECLWSQHQRTWQSNEKLKSFLQLNLEETPLTSITYLQ